MRHQPIPSRLFSHNRNQILKRLPNNALAIVQANDPLPANTDGQVAYVPNDDLFWLTGIEQEESILLMHKNAFDPRRRCILFLREPNELLKIWEGHQLSSDEARKISGIDEVRWLQDFPQFLRLAMCEADTVYLPTNEHPRAKIFGLPRNVRFARELQEQYPVHTYKRLAPLLHEGRFVKHADEIAMISKACGITRDGFNRILNFVRPGVYEYEVEAEYNHEFIRQCGKMAYNPIIASGVNSCCLHYNANDQMCRDGDVLLLDVAAAYGNYTSDLTRTIPIGGRFSKRQRQVYDAVLRVVKTCTKSAVPGVYLRDWQKLSEELITEELLDLGLIKQADVKKANPRHSACRKYFMHGIGHHLGLGVHDVGALSQPLAAGCVLTIEPGIYIPEEGFGIRIENDIVVTKGRGGARNLFADIPVEAEEIEDIMCKAQGKATRSPSTTKAKRTKRKSRR